MASNILHFLKAGKGRHTNDVLNKIREDVIPKLYSPPSEYLEDKEYGQVWKDLSQKWNTVLKTLCPVEYDNVNVKKLAGRGNHKDHEITFMYRDEPVYKLNTEFKHNCSKLDNLPQYYNAPEKKRFIKQSYAEYFYDKWIDLICELSEKLVKPDKKSYLKYIYTSDDSKHSFFQTLRIEESKIEKEKKKIVQLSIKEYLDKYVTDLNLEILSEDLKTSQKEKTFILWNCKEFFTDTIRAEELELSEIVEIKNNNTIVVKSKAGTEHHMLLRWKNHLGILYPAWQISLKR
jgi:hypothetical protein